MPIRTFNPIATAGPTPMHLFQNERGIFNHHSSSSSSKAISSNKRGIAAAVALATAATIPFPLKRKSQDGSSKAPVAGCEPTEQKKIALSMNSQSNKPRNSCICGSDDSKDELFIQCNKCKTWQHKLCYSFKKSDPIKRDFVCKRCDSKTELQANQAKPMIFARKMRDERLFQFSSIVTTSALKADQQQQSIKGPTEQPKKRQLHYTNSVTLPSEDSINTRKKLKHEKPVAPGHFLKPLLNEVSSSHGIEFKPITTSEYKDKYVKMFIDNHYDDDWVVCSNWEGSRSIDIQVRKLSNGKDLAVFISNSCLKGELIQEYLGIIDFQKNYQTNASNDYRSMGTTKPRVLFLSLIHI